MNQFSGDRKMILHQTVRFLWFWASLSMLVLASISVCFAEGGTPPAYPTGRIDFHNKTSGNEFLLSHSLKELSDKHGV